MENGEEDSLDSETWVKDVRRGRLYRTVRGYTGCKVPKNGKRTAGD